MLQLKNIVKTYAISGTQESVPALRGVDLAFRDSEFVAVLGPSGCGKTTLLNILGGLDRYTDGDLIINGRSTKEYGDGDWDTYRNHSIGFVFQSYNLIPHQSVLANVELALTLSGVSRAERRRRATEALQKVGLGDQIHKKPNQMSGGQMQRVAIARALVNDPDILLADEPTGALDTVTSVQIMDILKEISKDKLILMVTHNPELAETYANRIVRLVDGQVTGDTNPYTAEQAEQDAEARRAAMPSAKKSRKKKKNDDGTGKGKRSMSFATALSLSFQNLMTKKGRTLLTSFAGSIGIIGIALILALSNGVNLFIAGVQEDTLSTYPLTIQKETQDISAMLGAMTAVDNSNDYSDSGMIYVDDSLGTMMSAMNATVSNNLTAFKAYLDAHQDDAGNDDVADEIARLEKLGADKMTDREKMVYQTLTQHRQNADREAELAKLGVPEEVYKSAEFKGFAKKFNS
ncbi:MAG: ABC transporter ATP-binding protein, partial [Clostridia bacterium]|nr:ABC transporter ATP-binding protein [Clostridia bacterium]